LSDPTNTLRTLLDTVGPHVAEVVYSPCGDELSVTSIAIEDPNDVLPATPGGLAMLVGRDPDEPAALDALRRAAGRGFGAVVVKRRGRDLDPLLEVARAVGVAVIVAVDEIPWRHLDALLSTAFSSGANDGDDRAESEHDQLFSIANAVAAVVGGSVAIEDLGQHVLAYSSVPGQRIDELRRQGILDRRVPRGPHDVELYRRVMSTDGVVRFAQMSEDLPRAAIAIRAGSLPLGTMWAIEGTEGIGAQAERAIIDGARLAALQMLRARSAPDLDRLRRGELLRALMEETGSPELVWPRLGFRPGDRIALVAVAPSWSPDAQDALLITHVAREVTRICSVLRPDAPVTTSARAVYMLVAGERAGDAAVRLAQRIVPDASRGLRDSVYAAISSERTGPRSLPRLRNEVDQILRINAGGLAAPTVATMTDVQSKVMLLHLRDELERHPELQHPLLRQLIEHDRKRGGDLALSLLAWLEAGQNVRTAAEELHVHPNTLRYRLRRVRELAPLDLDDPDQRLATWLELRLVAPAVGTRHSNL
jgi:hypothetical protein